MQKNILHHIFITLGALGLASCTSDSPSSPKGVGMLMPVPSWAVHEKAQEEGSRGYSRAGEEGFDVTGGKHFYPFSQLYPTPINPDFTTISIFMATDAVDSYESPHGAFRYKSDDKWSSTVKVEEKDYYIFGFMPASLTPETRVSLSKREGSSTWADGAVATVSSFPAVTGADVSAVVGVLKAEDPELPIYAPGVVANLRQGSYSYQGTATENYVYLLLDHLYTNVNFELYIDYEYSQLRKVRLTGVEMQSEVPKYINMVYEVTADPKDTATLKSVTQVGEYDPQNPTSAMLFPLGANQYIDVEPGVEDPTEQKYTSVPGYFAPANNDQVFKFIFTYDVYDLNGNLIRSNCQAQCRWNLSDVTTNVGVNNGVSYKIRVCIKPTYLYQLGEEDVEFKLEL